MECWKPGGTLTCKRKGGYKAKRTVFGPVQCATRYMICRMAGTKGEENNKGFDIRQTRYILRDEREFEEKRKMNKNGKILS